MRRAILIGFLLLGACGGGPSADERERLAATQAVVDEQVRAGKMTEAEGRLAVAKVKSEQAAERRRNYAIMTSGDGPAVYQQVGPGTVVKY